MKYSMKELLDDLGLKINITNDKRKQFLEIKVSISPIVDANIDSSGQLVLKRMQIFAENHQDRDLLEIYKGSSYNDFVSDYVSHELASILSHEIKKQVKEKLDAAIAG